MTIGACSQSAEVDAPSLAVTDDPPTDPADSGAPSVDPPDENSAPIADAGDDFSAFVADEVELDGSGSYDPDGDPLSFDWTLVARPVGSSAALINESRTTPSFYADREGTYTVEVAVDDGLAVVTDEVSVTVQVPNEGPVANAGPDQTVDVGQRVVLSGASSFDPDGDPLSFAWVLVSAPAGSAAVLDAPDTSVPQFVADVAGVYIVQLTVDDGAETSNVDETRVTAQEDTSGGCLSCGVAEQELRRRAGAGQIASGGAMGLLPLLTLWARRRRRE